MRFAGVRCSVFGICLGGNVGTGWLDLSASELKLASLLSWEIIGNFVHACTPMKGDMLN